MMFNNLMLNIYIYIYNSELGACFLLATFWGCLMLIGNICLVHKRY